MAAAIRVGQIVGAWGLKGFVKVEASTDFGSRFEAGHRVLIDDNWHVIVEMKWHKNRPHIRLDGVNSIEAAELLKWKYLEVPASDLPTLEVDEFFSKDLIGMTVITHSGELLGKVTDVLQNPAHDIIAVGELLIPAVKEFVLEVSLPKKQVTVRLIEGMR